MLLARADTSLIHVVTIAISHTSNVRRDRFASFHDPAWSTSVTAHLLEVHHD
jgi:hypothetical protein